MSRSPERARALPGPDGYCARQLIPYLGNKRSLLPRLYPVFESLSAGLDAPLFMDCFAGSGAVSRLARAMGMRVAANDWEPYSEALNACWLRLSPAELNAAFGGPGGLSDFLEDWNAMHPSADGSPVPESARGEPYIARWYAPADTAHPRLGEERLFYSAENAAFIDRVRTRLENEFPEPRPGSADDVRRRVVLAGLILEAATHANTSGVFKAYHRGFGGNGGDALARILGRMRLEAPVLPEAPPATVHKDDARAFVSGRTADIAYFDPPYNQHQYGSNYHLLNTIIRWDGRPMPMEPGNGSGVSPKAGIPDVWKATKSRFCVKREARASIASLLDACDAGKLVFSWNADGHLSGEDMVEILSPRGRLDIVALDYVSYRGGRQSASRSARSREYLFVVDARAEPRGMSAAKRSLAELAGMDEALRSTYDPDRVSAVFGPFPDRPPEFPEAAGFFAPDLRRPAGGSRDLLASLEPERRMRFMELLSTCACADIVHELAVMATVAETFMRRGDAAGARESIRDAPRLIRKLAHGKYDDAFRRFMASYKRLCDACGGVRVSEELDGLERLRQLRSKEKGEAR